MHNSKVRSCCFGLVLGLITVQFAGCGPSKPVVEYAEVKGKVTYNDDPVKIGTVTFQPDFGAPSVGNIQADGTYTLTGVVGLNTVSIESHEPSAEPGGPDAAKAMTQPPVTYIPMKYASVDGGLKYEVKAGETNTANFDLTD